MSQSEMAPLPEFSEPIIHDPIAQFAIEQAREYQAEISADPTMSDEAIGEIIDDLNQNWPFYKEVVAVTGHLHIPILRVMDAYGEEIELEDADTYHDEDDCGSVAMLARENGATETCDVYPDELPFISGGFIATEVSDEQLAQTPEATAKYVLRLAFGRQVEVNLNDGSSVHYSQEATADIFEDIVINPLAPTYVSLEQQAEEYFAETAHFLKETITEGMTIAEALMAISELQVDIGKYWADYEVSEESASDGYVIREQLDKLSDYIDDLIGIEDEDVPFLILVKDGTILFDPDSRTRVQQVLTKSTASLVRLQGLRLCTKIDVLDYDESSARCTGDPDTVEPRLAFQIHKRDRKDDTCEVEMRLRDLAYIVNVRDQFYDANETTDDDTDADEE